ncbi:MAG: hypothetical protein V4733_02455 [Verrucomicrobiota bacterium]
MEDIPIAIAIVTAGIVIFLFMQAAMWTLILKNSDYLFRFHCILMAILFGLPVFVFFATLLVSLRSGSDLWWSLLASAITAILISISLFGLKIAARLRISRLPDKPQAEQDGAVNPAKPDG